MFVTAGSQVRRIARKEVMRLLRGHCLPRSRTNSCWRERQGLQQACMLTKWTILRFSALVRSVYRTWANLQPALAAQVMIPGSGQRSNKKRTARTVATTRKPMGLAIEVQVQAQMYSVLTIDRFACLVELCQATTYAVRATNSFITKLCDHYLD
ncbi:hypothetical protein LX36DRAFT_340080 [Colletotrichum falcatum]|nr:hypothetical protein LX36DRAFT_340080 [Colletotrichum falcatum]